MYKNSKWAILLPLSIALSIVVGALIGGRIFWRPDTPAAAERSIFRGSEGKVMQLLQLISEKYVDTLSIDSLSEMAIPILLEKLDPHSTYVPARDMGAMNESLDGEFDGVGVVFNMLTDTVIVLNVVPSGPSDKAGVQAGDRIVTINDTLVAGVEFGQDRVMKRLRGPRGTEVTLGIERAGIEELVPITVTRGVIPIKSILASYMIRPDVGYIAFSQFSRYAHRELLQAVDSLQRAGMQRLILDIRGNSGGFLDQAILITNEFLPPENLIVYTQDRFGNQTKQYSNGQGRLQDMEVAVLIDEYSASSSEILAGALQDNDRGVLLGRRSFGKGLVQEQIPFADGSAVRLTVARYYTPTGRSIQKPYTAGNEEYRDELLHRYENNELFEADSAHFADSLRYVTPGGKVVYGGGGIMPDHFVPADTTRSTHYFREVMGRNILYRFTIDYADQHRAALNEITTIDELDSFFAAHTGLLSEFVAYAARQGVAANWSQIRTSQGLIVAYLRGYIGRNTSLEESAFYHALEGEDLVILRTLEHFESEGV